MIKQVTTKIVAKVNAASPFGKFERFTAGVCMAIPFLLITSTVTENGKKIAMLFINLIIVFLPLTIAALLSSTRNPKNDGMVITITGSVLLFGLYILFQRVFDVNDLGS